jgi:hypothetical protein
MTAKTRYFVIVSLLVMTVGLGTGLVAYYVGFPATAFFNGDGPKELQYIPCTATVVGAVEVREIMASDLRQRLRQQFGGDNQDNPPPVSGTHRHQLRNGHRRIVAGFDSQSGDGNNARALARGVFDPVKINADARAGAEFRIARARG